MLFDQVVHSNYLMWFRWFLLSIKSAEKTDSDSDYRSLYHSNGMWSTITIAAVICNLDKFWNKINSTLNAYTHVTDVGYDYWRTMLAKKYQKLRHIVFLDSVILLPIYIVRNRFDTLQFNLWARAWTSKISPEPDGHFSDNTSWLMKSTFDKMLSKFDNVNRQLQQLIAVDCNF